MAYRSSSSISPGATGDTSAVPVPAGAATNDIAVVGIYIENTVAITPPDGTWTQKTDLATGAPASVGRLVVFWKRLTGADSGTWTFTHTASGPYRESAAALFSGRITTGDPFDVAPGTAEAAGPVAAVTVNAITTATAGDDLVGLATSFTGGAWTPASGLTERVDGGSDITLDTADGVTAGSTGNKTFTTASSGGMKGFLGALLPAVSAPTLVAGPLPFPPFGPMFLDPWSTPFQLLGDQTPGIVVSLADTGAGADTLTAAAAVPLTDVAAGADALTTTAAVGLVDTATGVDALIVAVAIPLTDTATAVDAATVAAAVPLSDTGAGTDSLTASAAVPLADTGTGTDQLAVANGTDPYQAVPQFAAMFLQPSAASFQMAGDTTTVAAAQITLTDTGSGSDALAATAAIPLADTATGVEGFTVTVTATVTDTGAGSDALTVSTTVPLVDVGAGADTLTATATVPLADTGTGVDALSVSGSSSPALPDTGAGTDSLAVAATVPLADTSAGADALTAAATAGLPDSAAGADVLTAAAAVPLADTATGSDSLTVIVIDASVTAGPTRVPPFGPPFAIHWTIPFQMQGSLGAQTASIPVVVTGSDRPATTVTGADRATASVTGSDGPTVTITST